MKIKWYELIGWYPIFENSEDALFYYHNRDNFKIEFKRNLKEQGFE